MMKGIADAVEHFNGVWPYGEHDGIAMNKKLPTFACIREGCFLPSDVYDFVCTKQQFLDYVESKVNIDWSKPLECDAGDDVVVIGGSISKPALIVLDTHTSYEIDEAGIPLDKNLPACYVVRNKKDERDVFVSDIEKHSCMYRKEIIGTTFLIEIFNLIKSGKLTAPEAE